jgi:hypothetical protein
MSVTIEHHEPTPGLDEIVVKATDEHGTVTDMFAAIDALEELVGKVYDGVIELGIALDEARNGNR